MCLCICYHLVESIALLGGSTGDTFVRINLDQLPIGMLQHEVLVILLLKLIGGCLSNIVRRYSNIDTDTAGNIIVVVIGRLLLRYVLVLRTVKVSLDASSDPFLLICFVFPFIFDHSI